MTKNVDVPTVKETIESIQAMPEASLREVVKRIPPHFLPADEAQVIADGLILRRHHLDVAFAEVVEEAT